ncbi:hypothetical protein AVEN_120379-1 [Araneus ventricosus]|uniref:Uncharacterized protein n=1 Tax=Araneus ventricosus TaxID=182803 RepID=A0A4Y2QA61_ARAVE|nr:hypothetical protein AVEN_120379-1 [Araneus ventricosus]
MRTELGRRRLKGKRLCMNNLCLKNLCRRRKLCSTPRIKFIFFFENPIIPDNAWNEVMYSEPPQEDINKLLEEFALEPIPCVQRNVVLPSVVPTPLDNYFSETVAIPPELPVVGDKVQDDLPLDLRAHCTAGPRKQYVFSVTYPLDLRVRH